MESSFDARIRCAVARPIAKPAAEVYAALARADRYGDWWPRQVGFETMEGPLGVGSRIVLRAFGYSSTMEVVRIQPGKSIWFRFISGAYKGTTEWILEPAEGGTRVVYQLRVEPVPRWLEFLSRFINLGRLHSLWADKALEDLEKKL